MAIDWKALENDKATDMSVKDLAAKFGCTTGAIYAHFKPAKPARVAATNGNGRGHVSYQAVLADLREKRDKLNDTIAHLEELAAA